LSRSIPGAIRKLLKAIGRERVRGDGIPADGKIPTPFGRTESDILLIMKTLLSRLQAFGMLALLAIALVSSPSASSAQQTHTYEMRTYYAMPGKLEDLKKRFREHTVEIFNRHNMKSVGYWEPQDNEKNYLVYILEHPSKEEGLKNWSAFSADPEWKAVSKASEANGKLVDHVDRVWLNALDFSAIK